MKEKIFRKGFTKRLFSVILALVMVFGMLPAMPMNVFAAGDPVFAETLSATSDTVTGTSFTVSGVYSDGEWEMNRDFSNTLTITSKDSSKKIGKLVLNGADVFPKNYEFSASLLTGCGNATIEYSNKTLTISNLNVSSITIGYGGAGYGYLYPDSVSIYYVTSAHTCGDLTHKNGETATCTADGWKDYYECTDIECGKIYASDDATGSSYADLDEWKASAAGKIAMLGHSWGYAANGATLTATCTRNSAHTATLTLTASDENYSGIDNLEAFNTATGKTIAESDVKFYSVSTEGATTGGTNETSTVPTTEGYYYASLTVEGQTAVKAFTIGDPWPEVTDTNQINAFLTKIVGKYVDSDEPDNYWVSISGDATNGFTFLRNGIEKTLFKLQNKGNDYYLQFAKTSDSKSSGYTFTLDENGKIQSCNEAAFYKESGELAIRKKYPYVHEHGWSYSANGATLIATCQTPACGETASLTLTASDATYSGSAYTGASTNNGTGEGQVDFTGITGATLGNIVYYLEDGTTKTTAENSGAASAASEGAAPVYVGKYVAKVTATKTGATGSPATAAASFEIKPAKMGESDTYWNIKNGVLTISGTGAMPDFTDSTKPWDAERNTITSVVIETGVTSIGNSAFSSCNNIASITIPNGVTSIGKSVFSSCSKLTSITIPDSVTSIGSTAFKNCSKITSITIPSGVTAIGINTFEKCTSLTSITIPDSVTSIGTNAFKGCSEITSITIPSSVTDIGSNVFVDCTNLTSVTLEGTVGTDGSGIKSSTFFGVGTKGTDKVTLNLPCTGLTGSVDNTTAWKGGYFKTVYPDWIYSANGATLTATCDKSHDASCTVSVSLTLTASDANYSGNPVTASYGEGEADAWKAAVGTDDPTIKYEGRDGTDYSDEMAPDAIGKYTAKATVGEVTATKDFEIIAPVQHGTFTACTNSEHQRYHHFCIYAVDADGKVYFDVFKDDKFVKNDVFSAERFAEFEGGLKPVPGMVFPAAAGMGEQCKDATYVLFGSKPDYKPMEATETWVNTATSDASFRSSAPIDSFIRVDVDGKTIDGSNYTVTEGSTIVTLKNAYIKTLSVGKHTVSIVSTWQQQEVKVDFPLEIKAGAPVPKTADPAMNSLWLTLILGSSAVLAGVVLSDKKRRV